MATHQEMKMAAEAFWNPELRAGRHAFGAGDDIQIAVNRDGTQRLMELRIREVYNYTVAGYWDAGDIVLLELAADACGDCSEGTRSEIAELFNQIIVRGATSVLDPPESILDVVSIRADEGGAASGPSLGPGTWLIGERDPEADRVRICWKFSTVPFHIGRDGLHAAWMTGDSTFLELSNNVDDEYNRIFKTPIELEDIPEMPIPASELRALQTAIDAIEADIRSLRARERDFHSAPVELAERLGKRAEYERLLQERDEQMWRGNPCPASKRAL